MSPPISTVVFCIVLLLPLDTGCRYVLCYAASRIRSSHWQFWTALAERPALERRNGRTFRQARPAPRAPHAWQGAHT